MSPDRVEVSECDGYCVWVSYAVVLHDLFAHNLALTIGIDCLERVILFAAGVVTVYAGAAAKYNCATIILFHRLE